MKIEFLINITVIIILIVILFTNKVEKEKKIAMIVISHILVAICLSLVTLIGVSLYKFNTFIKGWNSGYIDTNLIATVSDIHKVKHKIIDYRDEFGIEYTVNYGFLEEGCDEFYSN